MTKSLTMTESIVIITTIGKHDKIFDNMDYIFSRNKGDYKIALAYNGPKDNIKFFKKIEEKYPRVLLIKSTTMGNISIALNNVIKKYDAKYYFILDDDLIIFEKNWINNAINIMKNNKKIGIFGMAEDKYIDRNKEKLGYLKNGLKICDWAPTIMGTTKEVIKKCKFDPKFPLGHYDIDWQTAIRGKGYLITHKKINYVHIGALSTTWLFIHKRDKVDEWKNEQRRVNLYLSKHKKILSNEYSKKAKEELNHKSEEKFFLVKWIINQMKSNLISWVKITIGKIKY